MKLQVEQSVTEQTSLQGTKRSMFITFEGGEGAGKTTHMRFLAQKLRERGREVLCLREPGGTTLGERLRCLVLDPANEDISDEAELLIYEAARAQIVSRRIKPALERGAVVLCDRFTDSTIAYQVYGRGLSPDFVAEANAFACQGIHPLRTILMVAGGSAKRGLARATHHALADRLERAGEDFHSRVNRGFLRIAAENEERVRVVHSASKKSLTSKLIFEQLADLFSWMNEDEALSPAFFAELDRRGSRQSSSTDQSSSALGQTSSKNAAIAKASDRLKGRSSSQAKQR